MRLPDTKAKLQGALTLTESQKELDDAFKTNLLLKERLNIPFLFLCNGSHCKNHRLLTPILGSCMYLCRENSNTGTVQPTLEAAKAIRDAFFPEVIGDPE